jgi:hypothetical protein
MRVQRRKAGAVLRGTANYLQDVVRSYLLKKKAAIEAFELVKVQKIIGPARSCSTDVKIMLHKLRTSEELFPAKELEELQHERVKLFCKYLLVSGVPQGQIRRVFPTKPKRGLPIEWRKDAALTNRPEYQRAIRLHMDKSRRVKVVKFESKTEHVEVDLMITRCSNLRCERPWDCWGTEGHMCKTRRVFQSQVVMWNFLTKVCKQLRKAEWRRDLMEEWVMVHDFLSQCANERWSCLANIAEDKIRKMKEAELLKEQHHNLALSKKVSFGGLLPDNVIKEAVAMRAGDANQAARHNHVQHTEDSMHSHRDHMHMRWFHKRHVCYKCLATGSMAQPITGSDGRCVVCNAAAHHTFGLHDEDKFLLKSKLVKEASQIREPLEMLVVHCAWRYLVPMEHHR